jgi:hypothetical protein
MSDEEDPVKETRTAYRASEYVALDKEDPRTPLRGVPYLVNESGERTAVVISLKEWGELWEDFYDVLVSESRKDEPTIPWQRLKTEFANEESMSGDV